MLHSSRTLRPGVSGLLLAAGGGLPCLLSGGGSGGQRPPSATGNEDPDTGPTDAPTTDDDPEHGPTERRDHPDTQPNATADTQPTRTDREGPPTNTQTPTTATHPQPSQAHQQRKPNPKPNRPTDGEERLLGEPFSLVSKCHNFRATTSPRGVARKYVAPSPKSLWTKRRRPTCRNHQWLQWAEDLEAPTVTVMVASPAGRTPQNPPPY
jgi:hypothetical protein